MCTLESGRAVELIRTFGTMTPVLLALRDWLLELGVTHVAMEPTGVYWKAPYYVLEDSFELLLVNAAHIKPRLWSQDRHDRRSRPTRSTLSGSGSCWRMGS